LIHDIKYIQKTGKTLSSVVGTTALTQHNYHYRVTVVEYIRLVCILFSVVK